MTKGKGSVKGSCQMNEGVGVLFPMLEDVDAGYIDRPLLPRGTSKTRSSFYDSVLNVLEGT